MKRQFHLVFECDTDDDIDFIKGDIRQELCSCVNTYDTISFEEDGDKAINPEENKNKTIMTKVVDPEKISTKKILIDSIKIDSYRIEPLLCDYNTESEVFNVTLTDEDGQISKNDLGELYWLLFTNADYQDLTGIYYDGTLVAIKIEELFDDKKYVTWDFLGDLVVNCFIGINYGRKCKDGK